MNDFVSTRWVRVVALVASMLVVWVMFVPEAFPWKAVFVLSLGFSVAFWLSRTSNRPVAQVIPRGDAERTKVVATPDGVALPVPKAVH